MKISFQDVEDTEKSKIGLLMAHGPSFRKDVQRLFDLSKQKEKFCTFTTGEAKILENSGFMFDLDYWAIANTDFTVSRNYQDINKYPNVKFLYADSVDKSPNPENLLKVNFLPFDQRHFNEQNCKKNWKPRDASFDPSGYYFCCAKNDEKFYVGKKTIQEYVQEKCSAQNHYSTASTSALHMLATAIIAGCKEIYLFGVDLDYSAGYVDGKSINNGTFAPHIKEIVDDFRILNESANNIGIKIYNMSKDSPISTVIETKNFDL